MNFEEALKNLKEGKKVKRDWWPGHFIFLVAGIELEVNGLPLINHFPEKSRVYCLPDILLSKDNILSTWAIPPQDILAEDWELYE